MASVFWKFIFRLGLAKNAGSLENGEGGWDTDTKTLRVGDDTGTPPKILSTKSIGQFSYPNIESVTYPNIELFPEGTVDGVEVKKLNANSGILARIADNEFRHRIIETDSYLEVENPDGVSGNPRLAISENLRLLIGGEGRFIYGEEPPEDVSPGFLWYSISDEVLYILLADSENPDSRWWQDISSIGRGGEIGSRCYYSTYPPLAPNIGDVWVDDEDHYIYMRMPDPNGPIWMNLKV